MHDSNVIIAVDKRSVIKKKREKIYVKLIKHLEGSIDLSCVHNSLGQHIYIWQCIQNGQFNLDIHFHRIFTNQTFALLLYTLIVALSRTMRMTIGGVGDEEIKQAKISHSKLFDFFYILENVFPIERKFLYLHTHLHVTFTHDLTLMCAFLHIIIIVSFVDWYQLILFF